MVKFMPIKTAGDVVRSHNCSKLRNIRAAAEALECRTLLSAGQLNAMFGTGGIVKLTGITGHFADVKILGNGKILAAGSETAADGKPSLLIARFLPTGARDPSFGKNGLIVTRAGGFTSGDRVALLATGKFYVAGDALARFNPSGSLDTTFGSVGVVKYNDGIVSTHAGILVQHDGKVVITHGMVPSYDTDLLKVRGEVSRYTVNGTLDATFANKGRLTNLAAGTDYSGPQSYVIPSDVAIQGGKIIVGVSVQQTGKYAVAELFGAERLNLDGSIDRSFGKKGIGGYEYDESYHDFVNRIKVDAHGAIDMVGTEGDEDFDFIRVSADGKSAQWRRISDSQGDGGDLAIQPNGSIVLSGTNLLYNPATEEQSMAAYTVRLTPNLEYDNLSSDGGLGTRAGGAVLFQDSIGHRGDYWSGGVAIAPSGDIVLAGALDATTPEIFRYFGGAA